MARVLVVGIDGLDPFLLEKFSGSLPNFAKLLQVNKKRYIFSTFPPDSICAWSSIYTGLSPAEHGIIKNIDYLDIKKEEDYSVDQGIYKGRTFWDEAGKAGKKVVIINPFLAYPAWEVNGIMVSGPVFEGGPVTCYPEGIKNKYNFPEMGGFIDFPDERQLEGFLKKVTKNTLDILDSGMKLLKDHPWDLAFICFLTLDRIEHFFWRYCDENDPTYPGKNIFQNAIISIYKEYDNIVGRAMAALTSSDTLIVLSDHGHGRRCTRCFNLNEFLRRKGFLKTTGSWAFAIRYLTEKAKQSILFIVDKLKLLDITIKVAKRIPNKKSLKKSEYLIDKEKSIAFASDFCSTNPYGGVEINRALTGAHYENVRAELISMMEEYNQIRKTFNWVKRREEVYRGPKINSFPDILFELQEEFGVGWYLFSALITKNIAHQKISGGHREKAVFLTYPHGWDEGEIDDIIKMKKIILGRLNENTSYK